MSVSSLADGFLIPPQNAHAFSAVPILSVYVCFLELVAVDIIAK